MMLTMQRDLHLRLTGSSGQVDCRGHGAEASLWPVFLPCKEPSWLWGPDHTGALLGQHGPHLPSSLLLVCAVSRPTVQACSQRRTQRLVCALPLILAHSCRHLLIETLLGDTSQPLTAIMWLIIPVLHVLYYCHLEDVLSNCRPVAGF